MRIRNGRTAKHPEIHEHEQTAAMKRDEKHVQDIINHINNIMTNPFDADLHPEGTFHQDYMLHKMYSNLFYQQSKLEKRGMVLL